MLMKDYNTKKLNTLDVCGLILKLKNKDKRLFTIQEERLQIDSLLKELPTKKDSYKLISVCGGFSSISLISYVARKEAILDLYVSTFRIGKKQFEELDLLHQNGRLKNVHLITSNTQAKTDGKAMYKGKEYNYYDYICLKCKLNDWTIKHVDNHSKIILMRTESNYYVIETSSNLNENPKLEQFSFENDKELYCFYENVFKELLR